MTKRDGSIIRQGRGYRRGALRHHFPADMWSSSLPPPAVGFVAVSWLELGLTPTAAATPRHAGRGGTEAET